jgi:endonuclease/exonuclease/phosphatase family metal-dependent hydrolase
VLAIALLLFPAWAAGGPTVTVMTRNMWAGGELDAVVAAADDASFAKAAAALYTQLNSSGMAERAASVADEIKADKPDLISLQEVTMWRTGPLLQPPASTVLYDQLDLLVAELAKRGLHYGVIASQILTDAEAPIPTEGIDLRYTDRDVLLARVDMPQRQFDIYNAQAHRYKTLLTVESPLAGNLPIYRGWMAADITAEGRTFRFIATHLESTLPGVPQAEAAQVAQGTELLEAANAFEGPVIIAGDFNSNAEIGPEHTGVAQAIVAAGFADAWRTANPTDPGYTWPTFTGDTKTGTAAPNERIDLVFTRGIGPNWFGQDTGVVSAELCGESKAAGTRWASDHAGLVVKLKFQ